MTEADPTHKPFPQDWRIGISVGVLALCFIAIAYLIGWGSPTNSLHESALAWSFSLILAILVINGLAAWVAPPEWAKRASGK